MSKAKEKEKKTPGAKKALRNKITTVLIESFPEIKTAVGEKKFSKKVKKATRLLAEGSTPKKKDEKKKAVKAKKSAAKNKLRSISTETAVEPIGPNASTPGELEIAPPAK